MSEHKFWVTPGSRGDMEDEWLTPEQIEEKQKRYQEWLATATEEDKKPFQITMNIQENPAFDVKVNGSPLQSHQFMLMDIGDGPEKVLVISPEFFQESDRLHLSLWQRIRKFFGLSYRYETRK